MAAVTVAWVLASAAPGGAHNGRTAFSGVYGPYDVVATVAYVHTDDGRGVRLELVLRTEGDRQPVDDAVVRVTADDGSGRVGPLTAERYGNAHLVLLPDVDVPRWSVDLAIEGAPGSVTIAEQVPGSALLRGDVDGGYGHDRVSAGWVGAIAVLMVAVGASAFTGAWRVVMVVAAASLVAVCVAAVSSSWSASDATTPEKVLALVPPVLAGVVMAVGILQPAARRDEGLLAVFGGAAGLAVVFGWANRSFLGGSEVSSTLSAGQARLTAAAALGLGGGLMLLVVGRYRSQIRGLLTRQRGSGEGVSPPFS